MRLSILTPYASLPDLVHKELRDSVVVRDCPSAVLSFERADVARVVHRDLRGIASTHVLGVRDRLQVVWPNAVGTSTEMVENETARDRAYLLFVHDAVSVELFAVDPDGTVETNLTGTALPLVDPTRRLVASIFYGVMLFRQSSARACVAVSSGIHGWLSASTGTKSYIIHRSSSLVEAARGASGAHLRVAPFYSLRPNEEDSYGCAVS